MDGLEDNELAGFQSLSYGADEEPASYGTVKKKSGGGFQSMGLSYPVLRGIVKRGYKIPTPIQRKTIPKVLEGRDVVAMARTGSGKTACFLIPLFEKLKEHTAKAGARALILSPTRELALQTLKFIKELGRFAALKAVVILGGDSMENQFAAIHGNPDIIVATPGRFLHVCVEMELKLNSVEYVVFDEADRLFEMGFGEQLNEIMNRLSQSRQTLLFSATLPKLLVDFAKAGLNNPVLIRLDVEAKLPSELKLQFVTCRNEEKLAALMVILNELPKQRGQTIVFAATKYHVEYLSMVLTKAGIDNTYIYSNLDPTARKINTAKFNLGQVRVLIVTDVAARGIDIPQLDYVINYHFPGKSKLFVHRVGRCARAGRTGCAFSIVSPDEYAHLLDLHLFLGKPLTLFEGQKFNENQTNIIATIAQSLIEEQEATLQSWHEDIVDLNNMQQVCARAYMKYIKTRPNASADSNRRVKQLQFHLAALHPMFDDTVDAKTENYRNSMLKRMSDYRPGGTIFEICGKNKSQDYAAMKEKRAFHKHAIEGYRRKNDNNNTSRVSEHSATEIQECDESEISNAFNDVIAPSKRKWRPINYIEKRNKRRKSEKDEDNFVPYAAKDHFTEHGLAVNNFAKDAHQMQMDMMADSNEQMTLNKQIKRWDRKKKKMVTIDVAAAKAAKIRTESGVWISATYKSNKYKEWKDKAKIADVHDNDDDNNGESADQVLQNKGKSSLMTHWARHNEKVKAKQAKTEMRPAQQILKARLAREKKKARMNSKRKGRKNRK